MLLALIKGWVLWVGCGVLIGILMKWILDLISFEQFKLLMILWPIGGILVAAGIYVQIKLNE